MRAADYMAQFLVEHGINDVFCVVGGGAMHLDDAFGHKKGLHVTYNHHEQACAIAAESYARMTGRVAAVCVTTGPGGSNAITGVLGGWVDSIPMLVISGQVKFSTTIASVPELHLRQLGDQEYNIVDSVRPMTKYATMVTDPNKVAYHLEKALWCATHGRPGPSWLDVPLNIQAAPIDLSTQVHFDPENDAEFGDGLPALPAQEIVRPVSDAEMDHFIDLVESSKRPVIIPGDIIRTLDIYDEFRAAVDKLQIPVITPWNGHDLMCDDDPLYAGRQGTAGTRGGNFVVQSADLVISLASRLNIRQVSYNWENFAPDATLVYVDIDEAELMKPTLSVDFPIHADIRDFLAKLNARPEAFSAADRASWISWCHAINEKYPACLPEYRETRSPINMYVFFDELSRRLPAGQKIVSGNGSPCMAGFQSIHIKEGTRLYHNSGIAPMGWGLPAAVGAAIALRGESIVCLEGDGSIMMNLQELETVAYNDLNVKVFVINNNGYHSIRITQTNIFDANFAGVDPDSGVGFPNWEKVADAFGFPFLRLESLDDLDKSLDRFLARDGFGFCEVVCGIDQFWAPKLGARTLPDGTMVSPSLEDMSPFLSREELEEDRFQGE